MPAPPPESEPATTVSTMGASVVVAATALAAHSNSSTRRSMIKGCSLFHADGHSSTRTQLPGPSSGEPRPCVWLLLFLRP